jgi:hypothetical protein
MILRDSPFPPVRSYTLACDGRLPGCDEILDPGDADAPMGGWPTEEAAIKAGLSRGWLVDVLEVGRDLCPACQDGRVA